MKELLAKTRPMDGWFPTEMRNRAISRSPGKSSLWAGEDDEMWCHMPDGSDTCGVYSECNVIER